jgi:hypothetical protein
MRLEWSSSRYCLAAPGEEYLLYLPEGGPVTVELCAAKGAFAVEWFLPPLGRPLQGGDYAVTTAPYTGDAVLYLQSRLEFAMRAYRARAARPPLAAPVWQRAHSP